MLSVTAHEKNYGKIHEGFSQMDPGNDVMFTCQNNNLN